MERESGVKPWCVRTTLRPAGEVVGVARDGESYVLLCLPSWMIVGVYKSGTTDLFNRLVLHGDINAGGFLGKESHYFDDGMRTAAEPHGGPASSRILRRFRPEAEFIQRQKAAGHDASRYTFGSSDPDYLFGGKVIGSRLAARNVTRQEMVAESRPHTKLIGILRDPVARAFSQYRYVRNPRTHNADDFHRLVLDGLAKFAACLNPPSCACFWNDMTVATSGTSLLRSSMYWCGVREMLAQLKDDQGRMLFLQTEAYKREPRRELQRIFRHLEVREPTEAEWAAMLQADPANQRSSNVTMREDTRKLLIEAFRPFNEALFKAVPTLDSTLWASA